MVVEAIDFEIPFKIKKPESQNTTVPKKSPNKLMDINVLSWKLYKIKSPNDELKIEILRKKAAERSFQLSNNVAEFLIRRSNRDLNSLIEILDEIDRSSLAAKRKVTIPFIKELIS